MKLKNSKRKQLDESMIVATAMVLLVAGKEIIILQEIYVVISQLMKNKSRKICIHELYSLFHP